MRNLLSMEDVTPEIWDKLYARCRDIIARPGDYADACRGRILASLFFEPSTRTNYSFRAAMQRLGGGVFGFADPMATSVSKGETLADTVRITASYSDVIVMRSPQEGAAMAASLYAAVPVINAGDGSHQHPTQTLSDLTTIAERRGGIGGFTIGLCGDLKYGRTVHSLARALAMFPGIKYRLVSPPELKMPDYMLDFMRAQGMEFDESPSLEDVLPELDILYMTRVQRERFADKAQYERLRGVYVLTKKKLETARRDMLIMHPLPRVDEITPDVDSDARAVYFEQARYGMFIRMALLLELSGLPRRAPELPGMTGGSGCDNPVCVTRTELYLPALYGDGDIQRCGYCDKKLLTL